MQFSSDRKWVSLKVIVGKLTEKEKKKHSFEMYAHWDALEGLEDLCISSVSAPPPTTWTKTDVLSRELSPFSAPTVSTGEMSNAVILAELPVEAHSNILLFWRSFSSRRCEIMCVFLLLVTSSSFPGLKRCIDLWMSHRIRSGRRLLWRAFTLVLFL